QLRLASRLRDVPLVSGEEPNQVLALEDADHLLFTALEGTGEVHRHGVALCRWLRAGRRGLAEQGLSTQPRDVGDAPGALGGVAELADVAWPGMGDELVAGARGQALPQPLAGELVDQQGDVLLAVSQRGEPDREDGEAEVEVLAEVPGLRLAPELL